MAKVQDALKDKLRAIKDAVASVEKAFGKGAIMSLGEAGQTVLDVPTVPSGSLSLDLALGIGGYPRGRVIEVFGPEASGKTTLTLHAIAEAQRQGGAAAFIDAEHALDVTYTRRLGVDVDRLLVSQPDTGEQALDIVEMLVRSGAVDLIVVDSVAALVPRAEIEGEMGDQHVGLQARLMSQALRKLTAITHKTMTSIFFINQIRHKIGVMFGSPETTPGGNALKFYSSVRLDVRRSTQIKEGDLVTGVRTRVKVVKNKLAPPFRLAEFDVLYGRGIWLAGDVLDLGVTAGLVEKSGAWYQLDGERIGQGRDRAAQWLEAHADVMAGVRERILAKAAELAAVPVEKAVPETSSESEAA